MWIQQSINSIANIHLTTMYLSSPEYRDENTKDRFSVQPYVDLYHFPFETAAYFSFGRQRVLKGTIMPRDPLIGLVGKPSSGKSTTLNRSVLPHRNCSDR